jgi:hypothetical protein
MVCGFEAEFNAAGLGDAAQREVPSRIVAYIFRERGGTWEHREFLPSQLRDLFSAASLQDLIVKDPNVPFERAGRQ